MRPHPARLPLALLGLVLVLAACAPRQVAAPDTGLPASGPYAAMEDGGHTVPAVPVAQIPDRYERQVVEAPEGAAPGTILIENDSRFLYLIGNDGTARRYGIACGRPGFGWTGTAIVARKARWPVWTPPAPMLRRQPELARWAGGFPPGPENPLGARALYLSWPSGRDTGYRIHGTPEWDSIGSAASSGCIRMLNQDAIDLYDRVDVGTRVVVR